MFGRLRGVEFCQAFYIRATRQFFPLHPRSVIALQDFFWGEFLMFEASRIRYQRRFRSLTEMRRASRLRKVTRWEISSRTSIAVALLTAALLISGARAGRST